MELHAKAKSDAGFRFYALLTTSRRENCGDFSQM
jgi:hypothetical protein